MAGLILTPEWAEEIYQLETSDPVMGGPDGIDNRQAIQLGKRTEYLKKEVEKRSPLANPTFTSAPKAPTPAQTVNDTTIATTAFVKTAIATLVGSAPTTLDTLAEIAASLGSDGNLKNVLLAEIGKKANASHTHTMANITDLAPAMNAKANLASPTFTGSPKAPTPLQTVNDTTLATTEYVKTAIAALVGSAPTTLDTLAEIAASLGSDGNLKNVLLAEIGKKANASHTHTMANITDLAPAMNAKANLASPTFTGSPKAPTPLQTVNDTTLATTEYVKTAIAALVGSAPTTLDTLAEIAASLGSDGNLKNVLLAEIGKKANASHTHTMSQITDFELKNLSTEDLDTVKKAGMYGQMATVNATTARHYPEAIAGALLVLPSAHGWMQVYITYNNYRIYVRNMTSNEVWQSWVRMDGRDKADIASPTFTGSPKAPTPAQTVNDTTIATTAFVKSAIAALVGSAPAALDTLAEIATALGSDGNLKNTLLTEIGKKANQTDFTTLKNLLIGIPFPYPLAAVPSGCLAFNGQAFNKTTYPILAQKYPSGVLPDLRGEFIRFWDNGRGMDVGRGLLSVQGDAIRNITAYLGTDNGWIFRQPQGAFYDHTGGSQSNATRAVIEGVQTGDRSIGWISFDASRVVPTAPENRPRNIAFQAICLAA